MEARERIIERSIELFTKLGIRFVTMDQIAGELGISKRTIYEIFKDKDDLLVQCLQEMGKLHNNELREIISKSENVIEALYHIAQHGERKRASANVLFFEDLEKLYPQILQNFKNRKGKEEESVTITILKKGIVEGIFREELNIKIVEVFIHEMMKICYKKDLFPGNFNDLTIIENIIIPYFKGISTRKGQELIDKHFPVAIPE